MTSLTRLLDSYRNFDMGNNPTVNAWLKDRDAQRMREMGGEGGEEEDEDEDDSEFNEAPEEPGMWDWDAGMEGHEEL